jgi:ubiquinone/menaquinone biosynthesis C-methylase UbiE
MSNSRTLAEPNAARFSNTQDDVFGRIATRYDLLCDLFSLWIHRYWKRRVAAVVAAEPWRDLLDIACGTGDIVLRVLQRSPGVTGRRIVAADISPQMLAIAHRRLARFSHDVELRQLDAHSMAAVPPGSTDLCSISLGLKICNRTFALAEGAASAASGRTDRGAGSLEYSSGDASAYRYLLEGIREFPTAEVLADEMCEAGFVDVSFERLSLGIVAIHVARKP